MTDEKDPNGSDQHTAGAKLDAGKIDIFKWVLMQWPHAVVEVAKHAQYGGEKYTFMGWKAVPDGQERYTAALCRHILGEAKGERIDADGLAHDVAIAWNALSRLELRLAGERESYTKIKLSKSELVAKIQELRDWSKANEPRI